MRQRPSNKQTISIEDATIEVNGKEEFKRADIEVTQIIYEDTPISRVPTINGTLTLTHAPPREIFLTEDDIPKDVDIVAKGEKREMEIQTAFISEQPEKSEVQFCAVDVDMREYEKAYTDLTINLDLDEPLKKDDLSDVMGVLRSKVKQDFDASVRGEETLV